MSKKDLCLLLDQLKLFSANEQHAEIADTCLKLLSSQDCPDIEATLNKCVVALIKQDKYNKASQVLEKYSDLAHDNKTFGLLKLYTYYKLGCNEKFEELWPKIVPGSTELMQKTELDDNERALLHVRSQFCYKVGEYQEALEIYQYLASENTQKVDSDLELGCNERAVLSALAYGKIPKASSILDENSYDMLFNEAVMHTAASRYAEAEDLLHKAELLAMAEEDNDSVNLIELQLAYVHQVQGKNKDAKKILLELQKKLNKESPIFHIVKNNLMAFRDLSRYDANCNLQLALRELGGEKISSMNSDKYSMLQWKQLQANFLTLRLYSNVVIKPHKSLLSRIYSKYAWLVDDVCLEPYNIQARKLTRYMTKKFKSKEPLSMANFCLSLLAVQLLIKVGNAAYALDFLYMLSSRVEKNFSTQHRCLLPILRQVTFMRENRVPTCVEEEFLAPEDYRPLSQEFWDVNKWISGLDVEELLSVDLTTFVPKSWAWQRACSTVFKKSAGKKKRRKLPANVDPERWLPLKDRSNSVQKKKLIGKQTQGGPSKTENKFDITKQKKTKFKAK